VRALIQPPFISARRNSLRKLNWREGEDVMERRYFMKLVFGAAAGAAALAVSAQAAPLLLPASPQQGLVLSRDDVEAVPAVVTQADVDHLKPEQVRWGHHWHRRHWGWHRHHWHRHHWGWRHRHWHRRHW
jgi:hypothetical protein